MRKQSANFYRA